MGLDFLADNGACRVRNYQEQPMLLDDGLPLSEDADNTAYLDYESGNDPWTPKDVATPAACKGWEERPMRFVDGKDVGRTVAWLQTREGHPVPVRLSEIGAVVMREVNGELRREHSIVERVVSLMADPFPWDQVEAFAIALRKHGYRLLICPKPEDGPSYDFEAMRRATQKRSISEMIQLERQALSRAVRVPTIVDGELEPRTSILKDFTAPVVGLVKTHRQNYLHAEGWRVFYMLQPGQRTPAFRLQGRDLNVVSWYLKMVGGRGELPNWGVVRLEIPELHFEGSLRRDWSYLDRLSRLVCEYRCKDDGYSRAPVSIQPIQRAEESLGALFTESEKLISHFYRLTSL